MINEMIRKIIRNKMIVAVASIVAGVYLMIKRGSAVYGLIRILGYAAIAVGVAYLLLYFLGKDRRDQVQLGYAGGAIVIGLIAVWLAPTIVRIFPMLAGILLIISGATNLTATRDEVYPGYSKIGPILTIVLGALILFHPGSIVNMVVLLAGVALVLNGLSELDLIRRVW